MKNNKRKIIQGSIIGVLIGTLVSVSYAFFTYTRTGTSNNQLVTGNIWMKYGETNTLTLENAMPRSGPVENKYFEFTIEGTNTTEDKDIWYDISLTHGELPTINKVTKNEDQRIEDKYLRFRLVEVENNVENSTPLLDNKKYNDLTNRRIYVDKIGHGQTVNKTYRLYMWIDNSVGIGNTSSARYSTTEWNDLFASIKVNVTGDFDEKEVPVDPTDESCFTTTVSNNEVTITDYDVSCGLDVIITNTINGKNVTKIGNNVAGEWGFLNKGITNIQLPQYLKTISASALIGNNLSTIIIPDSVESIASSSFNNNPLKKVVIGNGIKNIPDNAFVNLGIEELYLGNQLETIGNNAFNANKISQIIIPDSVQTIGNQAFTANEISQVSFSNNLNSIGSMAFVNNKIENVVIPSSVESMYCNAFNYQKNSITTQITYEDTLFTCTD